MSDVRFLTKEEYRLLSRETERWLRLGDVELNPGEQALHLLSRATLRRAGCLRDDIASVEWTLQIALTGCKDLREFTLVLPRDADASRRRVSILTPLGLSFIGQPVGALASFPLTTGDSGSARLVGVRRCTQLDIETQDGEEAHADK